ncbi:ciliary microtubule associated protein 1A-like [Chlamydotis macqueenii]
MDGAWVGTWRPHRPRGPVAAQFTGPGPKYSIPGTTGYRDHNPTKTKAPAYTFRGAGSLVTESCSPGPRYYVQSSITRNGKYVAPAQPICGRHKIRTEVTPGPSDYSADEADKHRYRRAPAHSMVFRHETKDERSPGPGTYTLPRLLGPRTAYTHASPCYSIRGKSKPCAGGLPETPGPAAFPKVELDVYKTRAPKYTMPLKTKLAGDQTVKPGPADYHLGKPSHSTPLCVHTSQALREQAPPPKGRADLACALGIGGEGRGVRPGLAGARRPLDLSKFHRQLGCRSPAGLAPPDGAAVGLHLPQRHDPFFERPPENLPRVYFGRP